MTTKIIRVKISRQDCRTRQIAGVRKKKSHLDASEAGYIWEGLRG